MLMEEFSGYVSEDVKIYLNESMVESSYDIVVLAYGYTITHRMGKIIKAIGSVQPNHKLICPNNETRDGLYRPKGTPSLPH